MSAKSDGGNGHSRVESDGADLRRYLLGQMSEAEEAGVERAYLGSDDALETLRAREDELIEEYLAGALEPAERERFERLFLASPARLERLVFLRALQDRAAPRALRLVPAPGVRSWVRAAAGLAVVAAAALLAVRALGLRPSPVDVPSPPAAGPAVSASPAGAPPVVPTAPPQVVSPRPTGATSSSRRGSQTAARRRCGSWCRPRRCATAGTCSWSRPRRRPARSRWRATPSASDGAEPRTKRGRAPGLLTVYSI